VRYGPRKPHGTSTASSRRFVRALYVYPTSVNSRVSSMLRLATEFLEVGSPSKAFSSVKPIECELGVEWGGIDGGSAAGDTARKPSQEVFSRTAGAVRLCVGARIDASIWEWKRLFCPETVCPPVNS